MSSSTLGPAVTFVWPLLCPSEKLDREDTKVVELLEIEKCC